MNAFSLGCPSDVKVTSTYLITFPIAVLKDVGTVYSNPRTTSLPTTLGQNAFLRSGVSLKKTDHKRPSAYS